MEKSPVNERVLFYQIAGRNVIFGWMIWLTQTLRIIQLPSALVFVLLRLWLNCPFLWFSRWDLILTTTYVYLAFLPTCQAYLVENRKSTTSSKSPFFFSSPSLCLPSHLFSHHHMTLFFPLEPTPFMWALMGRCSLCLFLRIHWSVLAFPATHDRSILLATGRWCVLSPSVTRHVMSTPAARAALRCGTSVTQATRPLYPSWTVLWVHCNDPYKHDTAI